LGEQVRFGDGTVRVIGIERRDRDGGKVPSLEQLYIVGATSRADASGRAGGILRPYSELAGGGPWSPGMDDRIARSADRTLRRQKARRELAFVFTVQEVGTRGADLGLQARPGDRHRGRRDHHGDTPEARRMAVRLGGGPAINQTPACWPIRA
jgi:putative aminopeptidase FrvX